MIALPVFDEITNLEWDGEDIDQDELYNSEYIKKINGNKIKNDSYTGDDWEKFELVYFDFETIT